MELATLLRQWLTDRGVSVAAVISGFTPEHFSGESPPGRTATYARLAGVGITWDFVEAVADVITPSTTEHLQLLAAARPLWEQVLASTERRDSSPTTDIVVVMREMLDLSEQLLETQRCLANLRADDQNVAWALMMTCQQMSSRLAELREHRERARFREISASSLRPYRASSRGTRAEADDQTAHLLEGWARQIARFAQVLVRPEETSMVSSSDTKVGISEVIESTLRELDLNPAETTRPLSSATAIESELTDPDPDYTGGGFLQTVRFDFERLTPERFLPGDMIDTALEPDSDRVLTIPMIGLVRDGVTIAPGITVLAGPNGVGKSLVLEALSHALQGGAARRASGYRPLSRRLAAALEIDFHHRPRPQDVWYASYLGLQSDRDSCLSAQESFRMALDQMSPKPGVLYLLDEPEAALAPQLTQDLVDWMDDRVEDGCQFIIATHSMTLAALEHAQIILPGQRARIDGASN
ncbi:AAA family ATPase [Streptomyces sp. NPDC007905]|uniref:AAA family ATPase n=1 Tax=Streptomyces sp. NPDC007905 TaxID=3364788 RepID=UPI0036E8AEDD